MSEKQYANIFLALGQEESEAKILSLLVKGIPLSASDIEKKTGLSRGKVYQVLASLVRKEKLYKTNDRPALYGITDHFLDLTKEKITQILEDAVPRLMRAKRRTQNQIIQETLGVFQTLGYVISEAQTSRLFDGSNPFDMGGFYDYVADGEYRFAVSFIDETKKRHISPIVSSGYIMPVILEQQRLGCISSFLIINSDFGLAEKFIDCIKDTGEEITTYRMPHLAEISRFMGIEKQGPFIIRNSDDVAGYISQTILELHTQRALVNQEVKKIQNIIIQIERITIDSEVTARRLAEIRRYASIYSRPLQDKGLKKNLLSILKPVREIALREKRNLDLVQVDYRKFFIEINDYIESIDRRYYLPSIETINNFTQRVEKIKLSIGSIFSELRLLEREFLHSYRFRKNIENFPNPFIFTIPFEPKGPFIIDQDAAEKEVIRVGKRIVDGVANTFRFITGEQGLGKSHILENLALPIFQKYNLLCIRINSPLRMDLLDCFFPFWKKLPKDISSELRELETSKDEFPSSLRNFIIVLDQLVETAISRKYKGVVFLVDEFENPFQSILLKSKGEMLIEPLPIKQLRELLTTEIPHLGFLFFCRKNACDFIQENLREKDFEKFVVTVNRLKPVEIRELIKHRYSLWGRKKPTFSSPVITEVWKMTNGNTRDILKYLRELYRYATMKKNKIITKKTLRAIEPIAFFKS